MRVLTTILAAAALAGCAAVRPVPQARGEEDVVQLQPERTKRCRSLGSIEGTHANGTSVAENEGFAIDALRAEVARLGGNAFTITQRTSTMWRSVVQADAYVCPSWEPVPGLAPKEGPAAR